MFASEILFYNLMMISGKKVGKGGLIVDSQGRVTGGRVTGEKWKWNLLKVDSEQRVSVVDNYDDVLLRKRA
jgi:hypothetical protein